jgi:hypothetical protein
LFLWRFKFFSDGVVDGYFSTVNRKIAPFAFVPPGAKMAVVKLGLTSFESRSPNRRLVMSPGRVVLGL